MRDEIETIRTFDVDTQRTLYPVPNVRLLPAREFPLDEEGRAHFRESFRERFEGDPTKVRIYKEDAAGAEELDGGVHHPLRRLGPADWPHPADFPAPPTASAPPSSSAPASPKSAPPAARSRSSTPNCAPSSGGSTGDRNASISRRRAVAGGRPPQLPPKNVPWMPLPSAVILVASSEIS